MLNNILKLEGAKSLNKKVQKELNGGRNSNNPCYTDGGPGGEIDPSGSACSGGGGPNSGVYWFQGNCWVCY